MSTENKKLKITAEREKINLHRHGTRPWTLSPANVLQAAQADLSDREFNREVVRARQSLIDEGHPRKARELKKRRYRFLPKHIGKATCAAEVIKAAIKDRSKSLVRCKTRDQILLYESDELLLEALRLAGAQVGRAA